MPTLTIPENLYRQLVDAADGDNLDDAMWEMVHAYQRKNDPAE